MIGGTVGSSHVHGTLEVVDVGSFWASRECVRCSAVECGIARCLFTGFGIEVQGKV